MLSRPLYRTRQFVAALRPQVNGSDHAAARRLLGDGLAPLFDSMSPRDRVHCLDVCRRLQAAGYDDPDVLTAALLHDCGKGDLAGARVRLWHRVAYVLLAAGAPRLLDRLARRGGLATLHNHAETGAGLAERMGASERAVRMIREHERRDHDDELQKALRAADDDS